MNLSYRKNCVSSMHIMSCAENDGCFVVRINGVVRKRFYVVRSDINLMINQIVWRNNVVWLKNRRMENDFPKRNDGCRITNCGYCLKLSSEKRWVPMCRMVLKQVREKLIPYTMQIFCPWIFFLLGVLVFIHELF